MASKHRERCSTAEGKPNAKAAMRTVIGLLGMLVGYSTPMRMVIIEERKTETSKCCLGGRETGGS